MYNALNRDEYIKPMIKFFKANENKKLTENQIARHLKIKNNQMRYVLASVRYEIPVLHLKDKTYLYTTSNKELLQAEYNKMQKVVKQKCIKKNLIKKYL